MIATPFKRLFIANRGEIALRIQRTARRMGLTTIATYPPDEWDAPHVAAADVAVAIQSAAHAPYLDMDALIAAAHASKAEAVHPGYGFLAENADFAARCIDAGLIFVGPEPTSMRQLGNKAEAKKQLQAAGLTCIDGYLGADQSFEAFAAAAASLGYPVMIKARAGGGGRGMRLVERAANLPTAIGEARSEAKAAFADGSLMLERAVLNPRHIEVQVFGDKHGNLVHLFERDCSVQRRHQKIIEEAPATHFTAAQRTSLCEGAVNALTKIGYIGAGTMEFLVDSHGRSYFMEMNTRLQVEHTVTELITGIDLVEWQLLVAMGEALPKHQSEIACNGHAIEVRICAEDPARDFLPQTGKMAICQFPDDVRVESDLGNNAVISGRYDSLIAKLISYAPAREEARRKLVLALEKTVLLGVTTNRVFLLNCLADSRFALGKFDTSFIAGLMSAPATDPHFLALCLFLSGVSAQVAWPQPVLAFNGATPLRFALRERTIDAIVYLSREGSIGVAIDEVEQKFRVLSGNGVHWRVETEAVLSQFWLFKREDHLFVAWEGHAETFLDITFRSKGGQAATGESGNVRAHMGGRVISVSVKLANAVKQGDSLVTIEAMKMQRIHSAVKDGVITALYVHVGQQVLEGANLVEIGGPIENKKVDANGRK